MERPPWFARLLSLFTPVVLPALLLWALGRRRSFVHDARASGRRHIEKKTLTSPHLSLEKRVLPDCV